MHRNVLFLAQRFYLYPRDIDSDAVPNMVIHGTEKLSIKLMLGMINNTVKSLI